MNRVVPKDLGVLVLTHEEWHYLKMWLVEEVCHYGVQTPITGSISKLFGSTCKWLGDKLTWLLPQSAMPNPTKGSSFGLYLSTFK